MSNHARRYKLSDFRQRRMDEAGIVIETDDGQEFTIPPAELWGDDFVKVARTGDTVKIAKYILGDAEYDRYVKAGGTARLLDAILLDAQGVKAGE